MILSSSVPLVTQPVQIFFIVLVIILFTPLLLNKLKIPHIIGMIVAGMAIGPYGFNVLDKDSSFAIFGQVGLLYLMFLAGLEIDMYHLRLNIRKGLIFGLLTLFIPLILGVITSIWLLKLDHLTSMLLGAMYASHTLISYPVAARFGITKAPAVLTAIVGTIIAVTGALLVLAAALTMKREGAFDTVAMLMLIGKLIVWCIALLYFYPRLTRRFFKSHNDKVTQYVFVLAMVFFAAWTAQLIGLEPVLGAFFAGLLLNRYVPPASSLMGSIEFVGNALFIPYFLISVGMMINLKVIANTETLVVAGIMLVVAITSKWLPAFIACRINRLDKSSEGVMFGLTAAHTAVALAVVTLGYNLGMLDTRILNSTVLVILVTCAIAPIITATNAPKLKIKILAAEEEDGVIRQTRVNNTLIPVANPESARSLVDLAILMRNDRGRHNIFALHVRDDNSKTGKSLAHASLNEAAKTGASADVKIEALERFDLNTVTGVLNVIQERDITEVILGMHRRAGVIDSFFGNKVEKLLRSTNKMVLISRCYIPLNTLTRIVVWMPYRAQYETGFSRWVRCVARLTRQLGCRVIFCCCADAQPLIRGVIYRENYGIRCEFRTMEADDDYVLLANKILDDDLFVIIGARANSVSYSSTMSELPIFLQRYFSNNNLLIVYPEQFGESPALTSFVDPLSTDIAATPSPLWHKLKSLWRKVVITKRNITHRKRRNKINL